MGPDCSSFPTVYSVPEFARQTLAAGGELVANFFFPASRLVTGLLIVPANGTPETAAALTLELVDEESDEVFSDMVGDTSGGREPFVVPGLMMSGRGFHPFPMKRIVGVGQQWVLTLRNPTGGAVDVAAVGIYHEALP